MSRCSFLMRLMRCSTKVWFSWGPKFLDLLIKAVFHHFPFSLLHRIPGANLWCVPIPTTNNTSMYMCACVAVTLGGGWFVFAAQVVLVSATLPHEILEMTSKFMTDPIRVLVKRWDGFSGHRHSLSVTVVPLPFCLSPTSDELTLEGIKQFFVAVEKEEWKFDTLCDLYDTLTITQAVIFCNTKRKVHLSLAPVVWILLWWGCSSFLWLPRWNGWQRRCVRPTSLSLPCMVTCRRKSEMPSWRNFDQETREGSVNFDSFSPFMFNAFSFASRVLITTDIWARGIDVQQVSLVINYDLPNNRELYIHRLVSCSSHTHQAMVRIRNVNKKD